MIYRNMIKIEAAITIVFLLTMIIAPTFSAMTEIIETKSTINESTSRIPLIFQDDIKKHSTGRYDTIFIPIEEVNLAGEQNDIGYNVDASDKISRSLPVFIGEPIDSTIPGNGRMGILDPSNRDNDDWYLFSVCEGQVISSSLNSFGNNFNYSIADTDGNFVGTTYTADETGYYYINIHSEEDYGDYEFQVTLTGQNDASTGDDAGDNINQATNIQPGTYSGYMDSNDQEDWYSFDVNTGQGISITVEALRNSFSDYDAHLFNPSGELVLSAKYYGEDELEYPADMSGTWTVKFDMFPGWNTEKWPDDYLLYGSGAYDFELSIGGTVNPPIEPAPQPDIIPIAQTFIVNDDPQSNKDEYGYLAAIPAGNYIENGKRYVSPIIYEGCDTLTNWFGTVDDTTQYLLDDWETYLKKHGMNLNEYNIASDPIQAAADIATHKWVTSETAVLAVDGSKIQDEIREVINKTESLTSNPDITTINPGELREIGETMAYPMYIGSKWGAIHVIGKGDNFRGDTGIINPRYEGLMNDWWPFGSDGDSNGEDIDTFHPISIPGIWFPYVTEETGLDELQIIKYPGDRYTIPVGSNDCSIEIKVSTESQSNLIVYLIDPYGNIRRPQVPHYNGGEIKPIHQWNGGHWEHDQAEFRIWKIEPHTEFSVDIHYPIDGKWTAIVVPFYDHEEGNVGYTGSYHITAKIRNHNEDRVSAALSAANAAVIASLKHVPLLYVDETSVPDVTSNALSQLDVSEIIFVNINDVSSANPDDIVEEYNSFEDLINAIKENTNSENYITITSFGTGDGYFAPAAMIAAYHGSPILNIGEAKDAYNTLDKIAAWREYAGDYYHGARSVGHLPQMAEPFDLVQVIRNALKGEFPHTGFDLKLRWFGSVSKGVYDLINSYGLDLDGKEAYVFVSPRDTDIRDPITRAMTGNKSFAGHIPVETTAFSSDVICRNILYPALIYANPGRNITTSQMMNFPDGYQWRANDGNNYPNYASRELKQIFSSHGRFYEGHVIWDNLLERYNNGVSISYYSGHGTGGSGISAQYKNIEEQFPLANPRYGHLKDFDWWDTWRGYSGYDNQQTKTSRWNGDSGYNAQEPNLYDIIHFKWADQLFTNLHSQMEFWSSCTTGSHLGPMVYLAHGSTIWFGCAGSAYGVQDDLHNTWIFNDLLVEGKPLGESWSEYTWIFNRDFTTLDPTTLYGRSTLFQLSQGGLTNVKVLYGDPLIQCYNPEWNEPIPINP